MKKLLLGVLAAVIIVVAGSFFGLVSIFLSGPGYVGAGTTAQETTCSGWGVVLRDDRPSDGSATILCFGYTATSTVTYR